MSVGLIVFPFSNPLASHVCPNEKNNFTPETPNSDEQSADALIHCLVTLPSTHTHTRVRLPHTHTISCRHNLVANVRRLHLFSLIQRCVSVRNGQTWLKRFRNRKKLVSKSSGSSGRKEKGRTEN